MEKIEKCGISKAKAIFSIAGNDYRKKRGVLEGLDGVLSIYIIYVIDKLCVEYKKPFSFVRGVSPTVKISSD